MRAGKENNGMRAIVKSVLLSVLMLGALLSVHKSRGQEPLSFHTADSLTYNLYEQNRWKDLVFTGNQALKAGHDYFYLRMRLGIAYFMQEHYRIAALHFEKALAFNSSDQLAYDYLIKSYDWGGLEVESASVARRFPGLVKRSKHAGGFIHSLNFYGGGSLSNGYDILSGIDPGGEAAIYGEATSGGNMFYSHAGLEFSPAPQFRWYLAYNYLLLPRKQIISVGGHDTISHRYDLRQNQVHFNAPLRLSGGWHITPAFNLLYTGFQPVVTAYDTVASAYDFRKTDTLYPNYIVSLNLTRELPYASLSISAGLSDFNNTWQKQLTFGSAVYPFANLNFYGLFDISVLNEASTYSLHYRSGIGLRFLSFLWLEGTHTFGDLKNAHSQNGLLVYNAAGNIGSSSSAAAFIRISDKVMLLLQYIYVKHEDQILEYLDYTNFRYDSFRYNNHHIMGGIKWKL